MNIKLNTICLNTIYLSIAHFDIKNFGRYIENGNIPDTHVQMFDSEEAVFYCLDAKFNVKKEL